MDDSATNPGKPLPTTHSSGASEVGHCCCSPSLAKGIPIAVLCFACFPPSLRSTRERGTFIPRPVWKIPPPSSILQWRWKREFPHQLYVHKENYLCNCDFGESCTFRGLRHWDKLLLLPFLPFFHSSHRSLPCFFFFFSDPVVQKIEVAPNQNSKGQTW